MIHYIGELLGGLGLFFVGMWLLSENLKALANPQLRRIAAYWVPNDYTAWGWGVLAGSVSQNMSALTFITINAVRANLLSTRRSFAFILGGNIGTGTLVLLISLDIRLAAFYALGAASVFMLSKRTIKFRPIATALFGMALMFVGLSLAKASASSLADQRLVDEFLGLSGGSMWVSFLGAILLTFIVQSSSAVIVLGISMGAVGLLTFDQVFMTVYGSYIGSSAILLVLSWPLTGVMRRVAMFQILYNPVMVAIFVPLFHLELWSGVPLMKALLLTIPLEQPIAVLGMLSGLLAFLPFMLLLPFMARLYSRLWPATPAEVMSRVAHIHSQSYGDITTALHLIALEQRRVFSGLSSYLDAVRRGSEIDSLRDSVRPLIKEIDEFLTGARLRYPDHEIEAVNSILAQQRLIVWLEEQFAELCTELNELPKGEAAGQLRNALVEGIDAVVLVIADGLANLDPEVRITAKQITGDRSELFRRIRNDYISRDTSSGDTVHARILKVTNTAGEIFILFSRLAQNMESSSYSPPTSPPLSEA